MQSASRLFLNASIDFQYIIDLLVFKRESQKALNKEKVILKRMVF